MDKSPQTSFAVGLAIATLALPAPAAALCPAQLNGTLTAIAAESLGEQARWGALVQPLGNVDAPLAAHSAERYFTPASNVKLFTSAAALVALGPEFRITTSLHAIPTDSTSETVALRVVGRGDPSFDSEDLQQLAQQVSRAGISQVDQPLIGDERYL
ncbi:MAG: D-alanyl-D-alanine carboxypeptidase, partial [Cyanobacteria bacterium P01_A01_bin.135]